MTDMQGEQKRKYEFTGEEKEADGVVLRRIRALVDIERCGVKAGELGGWIEKEDNLSQEGDSCRRKVDRQSTVYSRLDLALQCGGAG